MNVRHFLLMTALWTFCASAFGFRPVGVTWEDPVVLKKIEYFEAGDLAAVKRVLAAESYSGDLLIKAFLAAVRSGNVDLVEYLGKRGWFGACRKDKQCDPATAAVGAKEGNRKMLEFVLSQAFPPTAQALLQVSAQARPSNIEWLNARIEMIKLLCEKGADPAESIVIYKKNKSFPRWHDRGPPLPPEPFLEARGAAVEARIAAFFETGKCTTGAMASTEFDDFFREVRVFRDGRLDRVKELQAGRNAIRYEPDIETYLLYEAIVSRNIRNINLLLYLKDSGWLERCRARSNCRPLDVAADKGMNPRTLRFLVSEGFGLDTLTYRREEFLPVWQRFLKDNQTRNVR